MTDTRNINPLSGRPDLVRSDLEIQTVGDARYLKIDQSTPQTVQGSLKVDGIKSNSAALKLNNDVAQDVTLFENVSITDDANSRKFVLYRKATEHTKTFELYLDANGGGVFSCPSSPMLFNCPSSGFFMYVSYLDINQFAGADNGSLNLWGKISDTKYRVAQTLASTGYYTFVANNAAVVGYTFDRPITASYKSSDGSPGATNSYELVDSSGTPFAIEVRDGIVTYLDNI